MLSIEASLLNQPDLELIRFNPHLPELVARLMVAKPDLVLIEKQSSEIAMTLLQEGLPLIMVDPEKEAITVLNSQQVSRAGFEDLANTLRDAVAVSRMKTQ